MQAGLCGLSKMKLQAWEGAAFFLLSCCFLVCNSRQKALGYAFFSLGNMQNVVPPATKSS
jgi:hypothetical protein